MHKEISQTNYRLELKAKILKASMTEFLSKGVKSVKMDDIANSLGISKRTLYEIYSNKEALLLEGMKMHESSCDAHMVEYGSDPAHSVIDIIIEFYKMQISNLSDTNPLFFADLRKYQNVKEFFESQHKARSSKAIEFFLRGVDEGYFRKDVDYEIVLRIGNASMDYVMQSQMYKEFDLKHIMHNIIFLFLRGLCTAAGIKKLDGFINEGW